MAHGGVRAHEEGCVYGLGMGIAPFLLVVWGQPHSNKQVVLGKWVNYSTC